MFSGTHILIFDWRLLKFQKKNRKQITIAFSLITSIHLQNEAKQNEALEN